ncbi:leucine-rich repeat and IQ domain-containing protein 1 [Etheostoma cragini]|uniref:leucine-rich repeat and IQ domain-containing protein 1 n=1 Tax=Etheostoma cragini TaxID=417921 RepID=UPI00155E051B|nr:leucine-rich repeat and IQ domain-containing protein 1 [Etheostoma cragini]
MPVSRCRLKMDANYDTIMLELNNQVIFDADETKEEQKSFLFDEKDSGDIPLSLLSYFETSKSRAAVCEKLILEEIEDFTASHHTDDTMNLPFELDKDKRKLKEQVTGDTENEENNTSTDTRLLPVPTEPLFAQNVSVCPDNEVETGTHEYTESEKHFAFEYEAEQEKRHCEKKEEERRQIERDFQKELKKIMEAEKLHQKEYELMGKRAQEKLEQELLLQQELISNLQRRVEDERRMRKEEQKRIKNEEDKRKREEEKIKIEAERKRMEEETRRNKEEERKIEEMTLKKEEERKHKEEEKRRMEREEKRKREEERVNTDLEKKKLEDGMRMIKEKEERKREDMRRKREKERKETEEARKKMEKEKRKMEEEISLKEEEEERKTSNKEYMRIQEEVRKKQDEMRTNNEEQGADERKTMAQEKLNDDDEITFVERKKNEEKDRNKTEEKREVKEMVREKKGENRKLKEELGPREEYEKTKTDNEKKTKEEEQKMKQKDEVYYKMRLEEDQDGYKGCDVYNRKLEQKSKTKEKKQEETSKREEEIKNVEEEKQLRGEFKEVPEKNEEEIRLKLKEGSQKRVVRDREKDVRANELQERRENNSTNKDKTENSLVSQLQDSNSWTSSSPGLLQSESTVRPPRTETILQQHHPEVSQTFLDKTVDYEIQAARPPPVFLPVCLPVHTEKKRLSWMKECIPWSKLSLQNNRKQKASVRSRRGLRGAGEANSLPPVCPNSLLQFTGKKSLQEMTTVTLEDLPGCSLSTLAQCTQLQSLTLRRCGLKSLEGINQIPQLCYIDVQENNISFVNCENMTSLRVLQLGHNKLTSIHGLTGAENLDVLDLSYNSITRIAGLESMRRLQRLSLDHNHLISTKGLRDVFTLLHLNCSHNHLASVEGLENSALLSTLDLRANNLTEPPSLNNQVLLRELHLDDNSISSLQGLTACWLPLMQHLSLAQNRITQLPSMSDSVSLANLDLRFNCMSELQNVCESLEGCQSLREVHLTGNPLQQERRWRSTLQKAVPGLRATGDQETDSFLPPPAVQEVNLAPGSFLAFCEAQLRQTGDLQQRHSRELSNTSSSLDAVKTSCRHFAEALQLAKDQRFAHEYGDTTVAAKPKAARQTKPEESLGHMDSANADKCTECPEMESTGKVQQVLPNMDNVGYKYWTFEEKLAAESQHYSFDTLAGGSKTETTICRVNSDSVHSSATKGKPTSSDNEMALGLQNTAAVVIQQLWRKYRLKCENISSLSTAEKGGGSGGEGGKPALRPSYINGSIVGQEYAATVIQAFWRGFTLRRRLASALAAVTCLNTGEDDTFEQVDMDEFVFDEAALEKHWTLSLIEDSPPRRGPVSEQPLSLKPLEPFQYILPPSLVLRPKQAWVPGEQVDSAGQRVSPESPIRGQSPASTSMLSGLSERSEKILEEWGFTDSHTALLMLKRAQKMKSTKQQQKKRRDPSVRLALFRNCSHQLGPVEAQNRPSKHSRNYIRVGEAELGLQQAEKVERVTQERAEQWLRTQAAPSDRDSESEHFLPEISADILNGGRVQLVADPGYTEGLHQANGLWANGLCANSILAAQPCKENNYPRRNSLGRARKEVPSPQRVTSAPSKKERISYRDHPVQLSGGWGGGKKRDKVYK